MSVKGNALFQIPDWIENDRPRPKPNVRPTIVRQRPNVIPVSKLNMPSTTKTVRKVPHVDHHGDLNAETYKSSAAIRNVRATTKTVSGKHKLAVDRSTITWPSANHSTNSTASTKRTTNRSRPKTTTTCSRSRDHRPTCAEEVSGVTREEHSSSAKCVKKQNPDWEENGDDGDILFFNHPSTGNGVEQTTCFGRISPANLMQSCGTLSPDLVFEANLHTQGLVKIQNLDQFVKLRTLDLSCNAIPKIENLHHNQALKDLKLYDNRICEITGLDGLEDLCHLQLQHNRISCIGTGLANQKKLQVLRIDSNSLERVDARELAPLSSLVSLDVSNNQLQDITGINALPSLEELNASHNRLETLSDIGRCKRLSVVNISSNRLRAVSGLCGIHTLMVLTLSNNLLTNNSLKALGKLQCLQYLDVSGNRVSSLSMIPGQFPSLEVLCAARNKLEDIDMLICLQGCSSLAELDLRGNPLCLDEERYQQVRQDLVIWCPTLDLLDGAHVKRAKGPVGHVPLMRPMSATAALSTRQVENQLKLVEDTLSSFQVDLTSSFADLRTSMSILPSELPSPNQGTSSRSTTPMSPELSSSRPASRCGSRQRIAAAQAFASTHFDEK